MSEFAAAATGPALLGAGVAGSGKSTLGRALAGALRAPLLDLDTLTNPLLDTLPREPGEPHWLASRGAAAVREGRYAALRETAREVLATAGSVVLVAPFTAELKGGPEWQALLAALSGVRPLVVHLAGDPALFAARRSSRAAERDAHRPDDMPLPAPAIPVLSVDAELTTEQQVALVLQELHPNDP